MHRSWSLLTAAAVLIHALWGCDWHHACAGHAPGAQGHAGCRHASAAELEELEPPLELQSECNCEHCASELAGCEQGCCNGGPQAESRTSTSPNQAGGPAPCSCKLVCEVACLSLLPQDSHDGLLCVVQQWTLAVSFVGLAAVSADAPVRVSLRDAEPCAALPLRLHAMNQLLLI